MQLLIILVLVLFNGVLAMSEIAIVSARRARLQAQADEGSKGAQVAINLAEDPNRFLSTVQIGITLVGIFAGAFGGTTLGRQLGGWLEGVAPAIAAYSEPIGVGLVVLFTTYLSLVLGELVPKRLGIEYPEQVAAAIATPMNRLSAITAPLVWFLSLSTNTVLRIVGINPNTEPSITDDEVVNIVKEGQDEGIFDPYEAEMVRGVLELDEVQVGAIMTPRPDIRYLDVNDEIEVLEQQITGSPHSFYPIIDREVDNVVGIIKAKDLLIPLIEDQQIDLNRVMRPPLFIPTVTAASRALQIFKSSGTHVALVIGEHGGIEGLLTINDVLEEIVGDIDADDDQQAVQREDGSWSLDGQIELNRLESVLPEVLQLPEKEIGRYRTLAGFIMARLHRIPKIGSTFDYEGLHFEVLDMDGARIDRVLVSQLPDDDAAPTESG
jgi:putative hemolysin